MASKSRIPGKFAMKWKRVLSMDAVMRCILAADPGSKKLFNRPTRRAAVTQLKRHGAALWRKPTKKYKIRPV